VTATGTRFAAGEKVTAVLVNGSRALGSAVADGHGTVSIGFDVPRDLAAGKHQVRLTGASGEPATTEFTLKPVQVEVRDTIKETVQAFVQRLIAWLFRR
jgi:hypothetical protein